MDEEVKTQAKTIAALRDELKTLRILKCPYLLKNHDLERERETMKIQHQKDTDHIRGLIVDKEAKDGNS